MILKSVFLESEVEKYEVTGKQREVLVFPIAVNKEALSNPVESYYSFKFSIMNRFAKGSNERLQILDKNITFDFYENICKQALEEENECAVIMFEIVPSVLDKEEKKLKNNFNCFSTVLEKDILDTIIANF